MSTAAARPRNRISSRPKASTSRVCKDQVFSVVFGWDIEAIALSPNGVDGFQGFFGIELLAQAADEHFKHIAVAIVILLIEVFGEFGFRYHFAGMQHEVFEHLVFIRREL